MKPTNFDMSAATREELVEKLTSLGKMMQTGQKREQERKVRNFREMNRFARKGQILFTGSSLMEQFPVAEYCLSAGLPVTVYNRGVGGFTTDDFLWEIDTVLFDLEPSKLFLNIGTNDINAETFGERWQERLLTNYREIMGRIRERLPETKVYVMAYYPVNHDLPEPPVWAVTRTNAAVDDTNRRVKALAEAFGFSYIDVNDGLKDERGNLRADITVEGVHIYAGGYAPVFEALKKYILE